jgi:hypothetical protein
MNIEEREINIAHRLGQFDYEKYLLLSDLCQDNGK